MKARVHVRLARVKGMRQLLPILAALMLPAQAGAQSAEPVNLSLEQRMLLRCSAAFAMVAFGQGNGNQEALQYPPMAERGKEFFVLASARVMDEAQLDIAAIEAELSREAQDIWDNGDLPRVMPACLQLLEQSGL